MGGKRPARRSADLLQDLAVVLTVVLGARSAPVGTLQADERVDPGGDQRLDVRGAHLTGGAAAAEVGLHPVGGAAQGAVAVSWHRSWRWSGRAGKGIPGRQRRQPLEAKLVNAAGAAAAGLDELGGGDAGGALQ